MQQLRLRTVEPRVLARIAVACRVDVGPEGCRWEGRGGSADRLEEELCGALPGSCSAPSPDP